MMVKRIQGTKCKATIPYIENKEVKLKECNGELRDITIKGKPQCFGCIDCNQITYFVGDEMHISILYPYRK